jgi:hypothetical protein
MLTAPITLAVFFLATQQPVAPPADGPTTSAQHDPEPALANRTAIQTLTTGKVKFELLDSEGEEHKASLVRIDGNDAILRSRGADYSIPVDQLRRIERPGDRRWDGAVIGFVVGVGVAALYGAAAASASILSDAPYPPHDNSDAVAAVGASLLCVSTALGFALDASHGGKHTLFLGTMPATPATHASALAVGLIGHAHGRGLQASYRLTF